MKIRKITSNAKGITIDYDVENASKPGSTDHISFSSEEAPRDEFNKALQALMPHMIEILELTKAGYTKGFSVIGATFSHKPEGTSVVMRAKKTLSFTNSPFNIATPSKPMAVSEDAAGDNVITDECRDALNGLIAEAKLYVKGERLQSVLNLDGAE